MNNIQRIITKYAIYFEELRSILVFLVKIFAISFGVGFFITSPAIKLILKYINLEGVIITTTSPFQLINFAMSVGFFFACVVTIPIFIYYLYAFLKPALLPKERRMFLLSLPFGLGLFIFGFLYGCGMLYYGIKMIAKVNVSLGVANYWDISAFVSQIVITSSLLGLLFIFPLVITFLIRVGVLNVFYLRSKRKHAFVVILILVSLLPPTDGLSLILMALPLVLIFELTILFNRRNKHSRILET